MKLDLNTIIHRKRFYSKFIRMCTTSKIHLSMTLLTFVLLISGCSSSVDDFPIKESNIAPKAASINSNISKVDAIEIANKVLKRGLIGPINPIIEYTYDQAVDLMAKLLYWIGKDVDMKYSPDVSLATSSKAYQLCKSLDFTIPSGFATFDIKEITRYLKDEHIVYLDGSDINGKGGHAWVSDACYFCVDMNDSTQILDTYIHCDWGWGGSCNGYYSGSVFEAGSYKFKLCNYFAILREWL